jgi:FemAB-related protein (PEP-CTERM system-associated)
MAMAAQTEGAMPSIQRLLPGDVVMAQAWDAFVFSHPQATFFHRAGWQKLVQDVFKHDTYFLYTESDGRITGVLPLAHVKTWLFGNALVSLPFAVYGGVVASNSQAGHALEHEAQAIAQRLDVAHLELRNVQPVHADWPAQDIYVTFRKALGCDDDANMLSIPRKQRAMVRKGARNGLSSVIDADVDRFYTLYTDNVRRHGTPAMPRRYFQALRAEFGDACEVLTVENADGRPLSSVLSFYFRNEVLPYYAGDDTAARTLAANDFKYWELMRRATARGVAVFDYGRSKQGTGSYAYKRNWGFEPTPLHYEYQLYKRSTIPQNNPSNTRFKPLIAMWRRLPLDVTNWLGPYIVRGLG